MKTIYIVTGGTGFVGNNVVKKLLAKGCTVRALIRNEDKAREVYGGDAAAEFYFGDVRKEDDLNKLFKEGDDCEYIFIHTAAIVDISGYKYVPEMYDVNVNGTKAVLNVCRKKRVKRLVYVSSVHAITEPKNNAMTYEITDFKPETVVGAYAKTKAESSALVMAAVKEGLNAVMVHPSGIIGPNDYGNSHLTQMIVDYNDGKIPAAVKGGYDFVDVRDVADGIIAATEAGEPGSCWLLTNQYKTVRQLLDELYKNLQKKKMKMTMPMGLAMFSLPFLKAYFLMKKSRPLYTSYSLYTLRSNGYFSHERADRELGYKPHTFEDTMRDSCEFLKKSGKI
jgi:dihydroflavonol-4-reductase